MKNVFFLLFLITFFYESACKSTKSTTQTFEVYEKFKKIQDSMKCRCELKILGNYEIFDCKCCGGKYVIQSFATKYFSDTINLYFSETKCKCKGDTANHRNTAGFFMDGKVGVGTKK